MIRLTDASRLAFTKLRTRKVRLFVTVAVAGLLFSGLAAASMVARGAFSSIDSFSKEGFGQRYIVSANVQVSMDFVSKPEVLNRANAIHTELVNRKKAEAKRLGIDYDSAMDRPPVEEFDTPAGKQRNLSMEHPAALQVVKEYLASHPSPGEPDLKRLAEPYGPVGYYQSKSMPFGPSAANLAVLKDGKESYSGDTMQQNGPPMGIDSFTQSWGLISQDLLKPFLLDGSNTVLGSDGSIPVLVPYTAVEQLLQLRPLPATAKPAVRLERVKEVRSKAKELSFQVCYRNKASTELLNQAVTSQQELEQNKNNKDYQKPSLLYGLPKEPCGPVVVVRDVRTAEEKGLGEKRRQFEATFGALAPEQTLLGYRVIGVVPDPPYFSASVVSSLVNSLVGSSLGNGMTSWFSPLEVKAGNKALTEIFDAQAINYGYSENYYVEFASADKAKAFIEKENCQPDFASFGPPSRSTVEDSDPFAICRAQGKPFGLMPYGSNSLALESARAGFGKFFRIAALILAVIAAIIMIGTVGRIIADSRRETAVFRAIGAKKADISIIYLIYTICLALLISLFAVVVGYLLSRYVQNRYAAEFTIQALVAYNAQDLNKVFRLQALYLPDLAYLTGLALSAGGLSAILPLVRNLRRNPIRDMRDEN